jgi:hypothetical protein
LSAGFRVTSLGKQAKRKLSEETIWRELATNLDVDGYKSDDSHSEWHTLRPFEPMFLAILWATTEKRSVGEHRQKIDRSLSDYS